MSVLYLCFGLLTINDNELMVNLQVAMIFGILGACIREELVNVSIKDIELYYGESDKEKSNPMILVHIPKTKTGIERTFTVKNEYYTIYKQYSNLRPANSKNTRFFLNLQNGKCTNQPIGINKFASMPKDIAIFLGLENPEQYTGHCFRRTSATLLIEGGGDMATLKRHGGWKSDTVAEGYISSSKRHKEKICETITNSIKLSRPNQMQPTASTSRNSRKILQDNVILRTNSKENITPNQKSSNSPHIGLPTVQTVHST